MLKKDTDNYIEWQEKGKLDMDCRAWKENKIVATLNTGVGEESAKKRFKNKEINS